MRSLHGFVILFALVASGCGPEPKTVLVKGRLVAKDGSPFKAQRPGNQPLPPGDPGIRVKFVRVGDLHPGEDKQYYSTVNAERSTFEVPGKAQKGIPPGKYQVIVSVGAAGDTGKGGNKGGPPGAGAPSMDGIDVAKKEVTIPENGIEDLTIEIDLKK